LFPGRGFPPGSEGDLGAGGRVDLGSVSCASWASYDEVCAIDWDEQAVSRDTRVHEYRLDDHGVRSTGAIWGGATAPAAVRRALELDPSAEVQVGESSYRKPLLRRGDVLSDSRFPTLVSLMACLADALGREHVRWVVWIEDEE
jgi:hypothetical protein